MNGPRPGTASADQPPADTSASGARVKFQYGTEVRSPTASAVEREKQVDRSEDETAIVDPPDVPSMTPRGLG
eukprot:6398053-Pyramimonas_sp.AAC.1